MLDRDVNDLVMGVEHLAETRKWSELDIRVEDFAATTSRKVPQACERIAQKLRLGSGPYPTHELLLAQRRETGLRRAGEILERKDCHVS